MDKFTKKRYTKTVDKTDEKAEEHVRLKPDESTLTRNELKRLRREASLLEADKAWALRHAREQKKVKAED